MAITLKSVRQENPGGCQHYEIVVDVDGKEERRRFHMSELREQQADHVMSLVSRFVTEKQLLLKDLEGKVLVEDAPRTPALSPSKVRTLVASSEGLAVRTARRFVNWWVG